MQEIQLEAIRRKYRLWLETKANNSIMTLKKEKLRFE